MDIPGPLRVGLNAVRVNAVPMVLLWLLAGLTVFAYYHVDAAAVVFGPLAKWQTESGWEAAFLNRVIFCGLLPGVFLLVVPSGRAKMFRSFDGLIK